MYEYFPPLVPIPPVAVGTDYYSPETGDNDKICCDDNRPANLLVTQVLYCFLSQPDPASMVSGHAMYTVSEG